MIAEDTDIVVDVVLEEMPACEGRNHPAGKWGHRPPDPAAYLVVAPCGLGTYLCAGWVHAMPNYQLFDCELPDGCGAHHFMSDLSVTPLDVS